MKNHEIVMEELKQLNNLDNNIYTDEGVINKKEVQICVVGEKLNRINGTVKKLVHGIRAIKKAGLEGNIENIEKGLRVFGMLQSIYAYNNLSAEEMASRKTFTEPMYKLEKEVIKVFAQYLLDNIAEKKYDIYTDSEGCSYNSLELCEI